jgi:hypothetical protein
VRDGRVAAGAGPSEEWGRFAIYGFCEVTTFPDGSQQVHITRTFVSDDPRIPIEKGAGTTFIDANGVRTVVGTPIHLIGPNGGTRLIDAGLVTFGDELEVRGPHPSLFVPDLAPYYCPS